MRFGNLWPGVLPELWQERGFGLYVHWPFCAAKCPYCDFNSHVRSSVDQSRWANALAKEIHRWGEKTGPRVLTSIFFGGGTPSLMEPETVEAVLNAARRVWSFSNDIEITLEANPTSVEANRFARYASLGVNRVSLGVQALKDHDLKRLGRLHSVSEAQHAFDIARRYFDRVSFDLIYARQDQSLDSWKAELSEALSMAVDHLSLYQLTIEDGTVFGDRAARGLLRGLPTDDLGADMWDITQEICENAGFPSYETSNHARNGAESKHNLIYWRGGDYVGVGPGAHGRVTINQTRYATEAWKNPETWMQEVEMGTGDRLNTAISPQDIAYERLIMGIRLNEGLYLDDVMSVLDIDKKSSLVSEGYLWEHEGKLGATVAGRPLLNHIMSQLIVA